MGNLEPQLIEIHPALWWLFALAAVSAALGVIWRVWLGRVVCATRQAVESAVEIVQLLREMLVRFESVEECMYELVDGMRNASEILQDHGVRISVLEAEAKEVRSVPPPRS